MKSKWSILVIFALLLGVICYSPAQAAPEPKETALGAPQARETISAGLYHTCAIQTDGTISCWGSNVDYGGNWLGQATPPEGTFVQLDAGDDHTCAIRTDGTLACWGRNSHGQSTPPEGTFTQVSAGEAYTCAIRTDGTLACWGFLPLDDTTHEEITTPPTGTFTQIAAGYRHACAIRTDGTLACWGRNFDKQSTPPDGTFLQVSAGYFHTCGIQTDGIVACWGFDMYGQATPPAGTFTQISADFTHTCGLQSDGILRCWGNRYGYTFFHHGEGSPGGTFVQGTAGGEHSCGLKADGTLYCWGQNDYGQATVPDGSFGQRQVSAGTNHSCSIQADGTLACWGSNVDFNGNWLGQATPPEGTFRQVSLGRDFSCGLKSDSTLACWGDNTDGKATPPDGIFRQVSLGGSHACGLKSDSTVACWGGNNEGQATPPEGTFVQVSAGSLHTCALKTDGTLACWGWNYHGQATPPSGTFTQVSAGGTNTCALKTDGTLACWGGNANGQSTVPSGTFTQVSAGGAHTCALKTDGTVACWGNKIWGQSIPPAGQFIQISAGRYHTCGTRADGMLECWGSFNASAFVLGPFDMPAGIVGAAYSQAFAPLGPYGGTAPYTYNLMAGALPPGLELSADGLLSGTPTELGTYTFTVQMVDANSLVATRDYSLTVNVAPQVTADPDSLTIEEGSQATFSAAADGTPLPAVQWEVSADAGATWSPIEGATSTDLAFTASLEQGGNQYHAVFSNVAGSATTSAATLTVTAVPPAVELGGAVESNEGVVKSYTFTSSDPGGGPFSLVAQSCGANGTLASASFDPATGSGSFDCAFPDGPMTSQVSVQVADRAGAANNASTIDVTIANLAPQVGAVTVSPEPSILGSAAVASATFGDAGTNDAPFTCAVDYGDGSGSLTGTVDGVACTGPAHTYAAVGSYTVIVSVTDKDGGTGTSSAVHAVIYDFGGFLAPVDIMPTVNVATAGRVIPIKFGLAGNQGLNILASGYPKVDLQVCVVGPTEPIETYGSGSGLSYDPLTQQYTYLWKTEKAWAGKCGKLTLKLVDGTAHELAFMFK